MKSDEYYRIVFWPPLFVILIPMHVLFWMVKFNRCKIPLDRISRWVATNAFSDIFKEKKKKKKKKKTWLPTETRWLFKDIDLTVDKKLLFKVQVRFLFLCYVVFGVVLTAFWQFLVWEQSYDCDEDDPTKDCFERKRSLKPQDPLNCSSAAVQNLIRNGTIQVVCNKLVFNSGLASGVSYGSFKLSMFAFKVGTSAILMIKERKILRWVQVSVGLLVLGTIISLVVVVGVVPSAAIFFSDHLSTIFQVTAAAVITAFFLFCIPWWDIICLKTQREKPQDTVTENCAEASA